MNAAYLEEAQETNSPDWGTLANSVLTGPSELGGEPSATNALFGTPKFFTTEEPLRLVSLSESLMGDSFVYVRGAERVRPLLRERTEGRDFALSAELSHAEGIFIHSESEGDEDSPSFSDVAMLRARIFLLAQSKQFHKICGYFPPAPRIGPGPNGSVDLYWKEKDWELLINIPADSGKMATFYGDDYGSQKIKGSFSPNSFNYGIVPWLIRS
jgi:hypothetical protein